LEPLLIIILILVLGAEFVNGWTDAPNAIATVVSTKVLTPRQAVLMATIMNTLGTLSGTAVAYTIGKGIVNPDILGPEIVFSSMVSLILWSSFAAKYGIPTSESHAIVAGLTGGALAVAGPHAIVSSGWIKVGIGLLFSTFFGLVGSFFISRLIISRFSHIKPRTAQKVFNRLQVASSMFMAYNHGLNDGQKFIGIFAMTLVMGGVFTQFHVPIWIILLCSITMGIGTSIGGWKIVKNVGMRMVEIKPWQGFAAETSASFVILLASIFGIPLSTTHTITTSIMGVAAAKRARAVQWLVAGNIVFAWILTFPVCGFLSFLITLAFKAFK